MTGMSVLFMKVKPHPKCYNSRISYSHNYQSEDTNCIFA